MKTYQQNVRWAGGDWTPLEPLRCATDEEAIAISYANILDRRLTWMLTEVYVKVREGVPHRLVRHVHTYDATEGKGPLRAVKTR